MTKNILTVLGAILILVGLLGFMQNPILGIFAVDTLHSLIHLASGILAIWFARQGAAQGMMLARVLGVVYLLVAALGFLQASSGKILGLITINGADNLLHVVLAAILLYVGFGMKSQSSPAPSPMA